MKKKKKKICVLQVAFFSLKFVSSSYDSITSSHLIAELPIILAQYFLFSQLHAEEFQT